MFKVAPKKDIEIFRGWRIQKVEDKNPYYMIILTQKIKCDDKEEFVNSTAKQLHKIHKFINNK